MKADWKHNLYRNDEILEKLHLEALDAICTILAEYDGYSADEKLSAIEAIATFLGNIEDNMREVPDDGAGA